MEGDTRQRRHGSAHAHVRFESLSCDQVLRSVETSHDPSEPLVVAVPPHPHHSSDSLQRQSQSQSCKLQRLLQSLTPKKASCASSNAEKILSGCVRNAPPSSLAASSHACRCTTPAKVSLLMLPSVGGSGALPGR